MQVKENTMKIGKPEGHGYFPRGPEIIPKSGTWQREEYERGRRFYETVLPGQRFPKHASPKELDHLANVRAHTLARDAAEQAVANAASIEQPVPVPDEAMPDTHEALVA